MKKAIDNLTFDAKIRAESSIAALKYVDLMIEDFKVRDASSKADILLDVFGLLQGLFVAIDALYQLSFTATKYKYHVNINQNRNLRQLKYLHGRVVDTQQIETTKMVHLDFLSLLKTKLQKINFLILLILLQARKSIEVSKQYHLTVF